MEQECIYLVFLLVLLGYIFTYYEIKNQKKKQNEHLKNYGYIHKILTSEIKQGTANFSELNIIKGDYLKIISSFLARYENMLYNEHQNYGYEQLYSIRNKQIEYLAESFKSKNPESIYDALSEMTKSVMKQNQNQQYYSRNEFVNDLLNISQLFRDEKYGSARRMLSNISKKKTDSDVIWITFLLRYGSAEINYNYWPERKNRKTLALIIADWMDYVAESISKEDKVSTLKFLDYLYRDVVKLKIKSNINKFGQNI